MPGPPEFGEILGNIDNFLQQATSLQSVIVNPRQSQMFNELLAQAQQLRVEAETVVPKAITMQSEFKSQVEAKIQELRANQPNVQADLQQMVETAKQASVKREEDKKALKAKPVKPKLGAIKMPKGWGDQLKDELLNKFGKLPAAPVSAPRDAAIWDDWQWNAEKPIGEG